MRRNGNTTPVEYAVKCTVAWEVESYIREFVKGRRGIESRYPEWYRIFAVDEDDFGEPADNCDPFETCLAIAVLNVVQMEGKT